MAKILYFASDESALGRLQLQTHIDDAFQDHFQMSDVLLQSMRKYNNIINVGCYKSYKTCKYNIDTHTHNIPTGS